FTEDSHVLGVVRGVVWINQGGQHVVHKRGAVALVAGSVELRGERTGVVAELQAPCEVVDDNVSEQARGNTPVFEWHACRLVVDCARGKPRIDHRSAQGGARGGTEVRQQEPAICKGCKTEGIPFHKRQVKVEAGIDEYGTSRGNRTNSAAIRHIHEVPGGIDIQNS